MIHIMSSSSTTMLHALVPSILVLVCQVCFFSKTTAASNSNSAASVIGFDLVSAASGNVIRRLAGGDIISEAYGYTITVATKGKPKSVTFSNPWYRVQKFRPYSLTKLLPTNSDEGTFKPLRLIHGDYTISAFVNGNPSQSYSISVKVRPPNFPARGPLPTEVVPDTSAIKGTPKPVPPLLASCGDDAGPPVVYDLRVYDPIGLNEKSSVLTGTVKHPCKKQNENGRIRFRLLSFSYNPLKNGEVRVRTAVLPVFIGSGFNPNEITFYLPEERCGPRLLYFEACVRRRADNAILCATSNIAYVKPPDVAEPLLAFRPPIKLELAPGDQAKVTMKITNSTNQTDGFTNDEEQKFAFFIKPVIAKNNYTLTNYPYNTAHSVVASLPPKRNVLGKIGVTPALNGALVYLRFARQSCVRDSVTYKERYATKIIVNSSIRSLMRQDIKLPEFETPRYPPTVINKQVTIEVKAVNRGGGLREGNVSTELHYQWYIRTAAYVIGTYYADPIINATSSTLTLAKAECSVPCYSRFGSSNLREYYVDVCNTFGCRRSAKIKPNILPPPLKPGQKWDKSDCVFENEGISCTSGRYCSINGVVHPCPER